MTDSWIQINCSLFTGMDGHAHIPWGALRDAIDGWRSRQVLRRFWFVRKPPGLRLRFEPQRDRAELLVPLTAWLQAAEQRNDLRGFHVTIYEPELHRFGGVAGAEVAATHFDVGAALALRYHASPAGHRHGLGRHELSVVNTSDLLAGVVADQAEVWDVWKRLEAAVAVTSVAPASVSPERFRRLLGGYAGLTAAERGELGELVDHARAGNAVTASALRALANGGVLQVGIRAWLAAATVFEWNRLGLPDELAVLRAAVASAVDVLAPDQRAVCSLEEMI